MCMCVHAHTSGRGQFKDDSEPWASSKDGLTWQVPHELAGALWASSLPSPGLRSLPVKRGW